MRIVCLLPSATEIVCALGLRPQLVGVSHECDFPRDVAGLPVLTEAKFDAHAGPPAVDAAVRNLVEQGLSVYRVFEDRLAEIAPDLIVTQDTCQVCAVSYADVEAAAKRVLGEQTQIISLSPTRLSDVWADIERVAAATQTEARGRALVDELNARLERLRERKREASTTLLHLEWLDPPMVAGHWTPELLRIAGVDPVGSHEAKPTVADDWSRLIALDPDRVLIAPCGFTLEQSWAETTRMLARSPLTELRAVRTGELWVADGNAYFNRPGPRLVESAEIVAQLLADAPEAGPAWLQASLRRYPPV